MLWSRQTLRQGENSQQRPQRRDRKRGLRQSIEHLKRHDDIPRHQRPGSLGKEKEETGRERETDHELCAVRRRRAEVAGWLTQTEGKPAAVSPLDGCSCNLHLPFFKHFSLSFLFRSVHQPGEFAQRLVILPIKAPNTAGLLIGQSAPRPCPFKNAKEDQIQ